MTPSPNSAFSSPRRRSESNSRNPEPQPYDPNGFFVVIRKDKYEGSFFHQKPERGNNYKLREGKVRHIFAQHNTDKAPNLHVQPEYLPASVDSGNHRYFMHESPQGRILQRSVDEQMLRNIQEAGQKVFAQRRSRKIEEAAVGDEQDRLSSERPPLNQLQIAEVSLAILAFAKKYGRVSHLEKLPHNETDNPTRELRLICEKYGISPEEAGMFSATCQKLNKAHGILTGRTHNFIEGTQENGNRLAHTPLEVFQMLERYKNRLSEIEGEKGGPEERLGGSRLSSRLLTTPTFETTYTKTNDEFKLERSWHFQPIIPGAEDPDQDRFDYGRGFSLNSTATTASNPMARKGVAVHKPVAGPAKTEYPANLGLLLPQIYEEGSEAVSGRASQTNIAERVFKKPQKLTQDKHTHSPAQLKADLSSEAQGDEDDGLTFAHTNPSSSEFHFLSPRSASAIVRGPAALVVHIAKNKSPSPQTSTRKSPTESQQMTDNPGRFAKDGGNTRVAEQSNVLRGESPSHGSIKSMQERLNPDQSSFHMGEVYETSSVPSSPRPETQNPLSAKSKKNTRAQLPATEAAEGLVKSSTNAPTRPRAKSLDSYERKVPLAELDHQSVDTRHELRATSKQNIANLRPHSPSQNSVAATLDSDQSLQQPSTPPSRRDSFNASDSESDELRRLLNNVEHGISAAQDDHLLMQELDTLQHAVDLTVARTTAEAETPDSTSRPESATSLGTSSTHSRDSGK